MSGRRIVSGGALRADTIVATLRGYEHRVLGDRLRTRWELTIVVNNRKVVGPFDIRAETKTEAMERADKIIQKVKKDVGGSPTVIRRSANPGEAAVEGASGDWYGALTQEEMRRRKRSAHEAEVVGEFHRRTLGRYR